VDAAGEKGHDQENIPATFRSHNSLSIVSRTDRSLDPRSGFAEKRPSDPTDAAKS